MGAKNKTPAKAATATTKVDHVPPQEAAVDVGLSPLESTKEPSFPVVGIGASAGGLAAIEAFFAGMSADTDPGMAFVVVQHLSPDHKSILTEIVQRYTRMHVFEVEDGMRVKPNCVYIIPPNREMAFLNGTLHLMTPSAPRGHRLPIDYFFQSLAQDQRELAIGIVLSGTGSDGTQGVRAIKGEGGMVMAQNPESTEYDGMPRSAIGTGLVDYQLPPAEMAGHLIAYMRHAFGKLPRTVTAPLSATENALKKVFILLRACTKHDFSQYKLSTVQRRIERRMALHQIATLDEYIQYLQHSTDELQALFRDLLIGVTSFFRDPEAFKALEEQIIPKIFADKPTGAVIRVWSPGCSTGEEAYSIAILLHEYVESSKLGFKLQVFATDIDSNAIATARLGIYPASIAADLSPERLARFFTADAGGSAYRVNKTIRDILVFSEQDLIRDPPFSKLDLVSCRNLLIYVNAELQKKLIPLFHYALKPGGFLFLGSSESIGDFGNLFVTQERKLKLYQRAEMVGHQSDSTQQVQPSTVRRDVVPASVPAQARPERGGRLRLRELAEQSLLSEFTPPSALVNERGDILYLHGRTGMFLEPAPGEGGVNNILKMAREGLLDVLAVALHKAASKKEAVFRPGLRVKTNGDFTMVDITVRPVSQGPVAITDSPLYLITMQNAGPVVSPKPQGKLPRKTVATAQDGEMQAQIAELKLELQAKEEYLQTANEELETSNEELKSSNEEMQSVNEELQSANEELETSKEELQSVNEELSTVNAELQTKVTDLSQTNNDMNNLLAGTGIGTVFVDHQLRILRFTPAITQIINLISTDVGRSVGHIVSNLIGYDQLATDIKAVLDTLIPKEIEVKMRTGGWYRMHIRTYRTLDNVIEGAVITFVDITELRKTQDSLRETGENFRNLAKNSRDAILMADEEKVAFVNQACLKMFGARNDLHLLAKPIQELFHPDSHDRIGKNTPRLQNGNDLLVPVKGKIVRLDGSFLEVEVITIPSLHEDSKCIHYIIRDINESKPEGS